MAYRDWLKEYRESQGSQTTPSKKSSEDSKTPSGTSKKSTSGSAGSGGSSFRDTLNAYRDEQAGKSMQGWAETSINIIKDARNRSSDWFDDDEYNYQSDRFTRLLAQADSWRKQYTGNSDAISYIDSVVDALSQAKNSTYDTRKYYSQWKTADDYKSYLAQQKDYEEKKSYDLTAGQKEVDTLKSVLAEANDIQRQLNAFSVAQSRSNTAYVANKTTELRSRLAQITEQYGGVEGLETLVNQKKQYLNQAKHIQEGITLSGVINNDDFNAKSGYASTKSEGAWDKLTSQFGMGYDDLTYEYINGEESGMRQEIRNKAVSWDADTEKFSIYDHMTDDQIATYNYYYAKDGKEAAEKYLDSIRETLNYQAASERFGKMEGNTALEMLFGIEAGLDQFQSGMKNLFNTEDDYIAQTATQIASGMVREDLADDGFKLPDWMGGASIGQVGYDAITTTANMAPSILASIGMNIIAPGSGSVVGTAMMGMSAAGGAYQEALNKGFDKDQARGYSTLVGASEAVLGYLLGGVSKLGGKLSNKAITALLNNVDNALLRTAGRIGGNMLSEFTEEYLQEVLTPLFSNWMMGTDEEVSLFSAEALYSGLLGALTAGIMEGPSTIAGEVSAYTQGKALKAADISAERLAELGQTFSADTVAHRLAGRVNDKTGAYTMGRLFNEISATLSEQNVNEITEALVAKGMDEATAKKNAEALAYVVEGGQLTDRQIAVIEANEVLAEVARTTLIDANTTWNQRSKGYNEMLKSLADEMTAPKATKASPAQQTQENAPVADTVDAQNEISSESLSEAVDTSPAKVQTISAIEKGKVTVKLEDGTEVDVKKADLSVDDGVRIETIASIDGISMEDANFILNTLRTSTNASAQMDSLGAKEAYKYGFYGFSQEHIAKHGVFANSLSETQRQAIYETGRTARQRQVDAKQAVAKNATTTNKDSNKVSGKVHFDGDRATLTERQSASLTAMEKIASALGVQIYVFESELNERGKRVGANGWYDPKDSSIHIDLHAGANGEGTMLFTLAHELTHHIRKWSPAKFKTLADFLMQEYGKKGVNIDALVRQQMKKAKANGRTISYDTAYEEVVADSMESMLADGNVMKRLEKLKAQDKDLWYQIKKFIDDLATKIRNIYKGLKPDSVEGRYVADMGKAVYRLQEMFAEALVEASENYQSSEQVLAQAGISVNAETDSGSLLSVRDVLSEEDRNKVAKALADRFQVTVEEAKEWLKAETSLASLILNPKYSMFLDYEADPNEVAIKQNSDYPQGTVDFSNICKKRREFTQVMNRILRNFPNHVFAATDLARIRTIMGEEGMTLPCGICYVEDRRQLDTIVAQDFINGLKLYREGSKTRPDGKAFNANQLKGLKLTDGDTYVPSIYELVTLEGRNSLKAKNPNMEAAWVKYNNARGMQSVRLLTNEAEYKRQILKYNKNTVKSKNDKGGLRIYSFSDAEMFHLIDIIQVITDSATVGLSIQGYTKVNEYAKAVKDTGLKLNRSLIPKGKLGYHMENGKVVLDYDTVEGIDIYSKDFFDNKDNPNVGNITIGINDTQIRAAMVSPFVDQIIPFHTGQSEDVLGEKGIATWDNYKDFQTEKNLETGTTAEHQINIYTEVFQAAEEEGKPIQNKRQFVEKFLEVCKKNGLKPRFAQFLNTDANGDYIYTEGYHKFLVDFKTFAQTEVGEYLPQMPVKPIFDNAYITGLLEAYVEEQKVKDAEVAEQMPKVIERITNEIINQDEVKRSDRVTDQETLDFLNNQIENGEYITVYRSFQVIDGGLYAPMNAVDRDEDGKNKRLGYRSELGKWEKATESPEIAQRYMDKHPNAQWASFDLDGVDNKTSGVAYNPYLHASNLVLNDQFAAAYRRNLVTVECRVPLSEVGAYHAKYAKDTTGWVEWKPGGVAGKLMKVKPEYTRKLFVSRYMLPVRIIPDSEVAQMYKEYLDGTNIQVPWNVVTPSLRKELVKAGVKISYKDVKGSNYTRVFSEIFPDDASEAVRYSDRNDAPTFYSQMAKVIEGVKQEKLGAASVVSMLRGKGVKAEEIKWSGIEEWLAGKKSVTKTDLLEFILMRKRSPIRRCLIVRSIWIRLPSTKLREMPSLITSSPSGRELSVLISPSPILVLVLTALLCRNCWRSTPL